MFEYLAIVERVVDADTYVCSVDCGFHIKIQLTIRLLGVDAYETKLIRGNTEEQVEKGIEGKKYFKNLLTGKTVILRTHVDSNDKYGRYLGEMYLGTELGDVCINEELIRLGFGIRK